MKQLALNTTPIVEPDMALPGGHENYFRLDCGLVQPLTRFEGSPGPMAPIPVQETELACLLADIKELLAEIRDVLTDGLK